MMQLSPAYGPARLPLVISAVQRQCLLSEELPGSNRGRIRAASIVVPVHCACGIFGMPGVKCGPVSIRSRHLGTGCMRKYMYAVSSCRPALAELEHRWRLLQRAVLGPGWGTLLAQHVETATDSALSGVVGRGGLNPRLRPSVGRNASFSGWWMPGDGDRGAGRAAFGGHGAGGKPGGAFDSAPAGDGHGRVGPRAGLPADRAGAGL